MKRVSFFIVLISVALAVVSCGSSKAVVAISQPQEVKSLEGDVAVKQNIKMQGIEMSDVLSADGTKIEKIPYRWFAGISKADDKQIAIEMAQREAYATISRMIDNAVFDSAKRGAIGNNGKVQQAIKSHWEQVSSSLQKGCEPFGDVQLLYNSTTRMYEATAKVGIRGDKYTQLLNTAAEVKPKDLSVEEYKQFIEINNNIINAAKGN